jgi:hypothetical protein
MTSGEDLCVHVVGGTPGEPGGTLSYCGHGAWERCTEHRGAYLHERGARLPYATCEHQHPFKAGSVADTRTSDLSPVGSTTVEEARKSLRGWATVIAGAKSQVPLFHESIAEFEASVRAEERSRIAALEDAARLIVRLLPLYVGRAAPLGNVPRVSLSDAVHAIADLLTEENNGG